MRNILSTLDCGNLAGIEKIDHITDYFIGIEASQMG